MNFSIKNTGYYIFIITLNTIPLNNYQIENIYFKFHY